MEILKADGDCINNRGRTIRLQPSILFFPSHFPAGDFSAKWYKSKEGKNKDESNYGPDPV